VTIFVDILSPRAKRRARIEIPLIDIMFFFLATFVMVLLSCHGVAFLSWCRFQ
jgi:TRAP-type mannitol/chloroaromatic compound transport system permease small subunit